MSDRKPRVLFVDDEPNITQAMSWIFRKGYEVKVANSGEEALSMLKGFDPDVVVSDQRMPGMAGTQLLEQVKLQCPRAMRLLLTGYSDYKAIVNSVNDGEIWRFVHKPWDNVKIREVVAEAAETAMKAAVLPSENEAPEEEVAKKAGTILVIDDDSSCVAKLKEALGGRYRVEYAVRLQDALDILEQKPISVVISEISVDNVDATTLLKVLKSQQPNIVTVVLSETNDAATVIDLINEGQVYRVLHKPIKPAQCQISISSAMRKHLQLNANPELQKRHVVQKIAIQDLPEKDAGLMGRVVGSVKKMSRLWH